MKEALGLMGIYIGVLLALQAGGFLLSQLVGYFHPTMSLMTFLVCFMGMFALAWPIAVRISDRLIPESDQERTVRLARV